MDMSQQTTLNSKVTLFPSVKTENFFGDHDLLTGLLNKKGFISRFTDALENQSHEGGMLLLFDIDRLKRINILHGRMAGDSILKLLADLLKVQKTEGDILCRLSKDKFALALTDIEIKQGFKKASDIQKRISPIKMIVNDEIIEVNVFMTAIPYVKDATTTEVLSIATNLLTTSKNKQKEKQIPAYLGA